MTVGCGVISFPACYCFIDTCEIVYEDYEVRVYDESRFFFTISGVSSSHGTDER